MIFHKLMQQYKPVKYGWLFVFLLFNICVFAADSLVVSSPDKKIKLSLHHKAHLSYTIRFLNEVVIQSSKVDLLLANGKSLSADLSISKKKIRSFAGKIVSPVPEKRQVIPDIYNELTVRFKQPYSLLIRVYNDGIAYRFITHFKDSITIKNEVSEFNFPPGKKILLTNN